MPVPKRKTSKCRRNLRNAGRKAKQRFFVDCQNCKEALRPHQACLNCGFYKGVKVLDTKADRAVRRAEKANAIEKAIQARPTSAAQ